MTKNSLFNEAFNFESFKSSNPIHDEPIGKDLIDQLASECIRVKKLNPPSEITHLENNNDVIEPVQYPTNFKNASTNLSCLVWIRQKIEHSRRIIIESAESNQIGIEQLNNIFIEHDLEIHSMFKTALSIGQHNQEVNSSHFFEIGLKKALAEQQKADERFYNQYYTSMLIMGDILNDFYSYEENHPYKPQVVIDSIEMLCLENNLEFPKDRKSDNFCRFQKKILSNLLPHKNWRGSTKSEYKHIDTKVFRKKYQPLFKKYPLI